MRRSYSGEPDGGWRKSRYSNPSGSCVEVACWRDAYPADAPEVTGVR